MDDPATAEDVGCTAARLFELVWEAMADILGTPATATLIRRSTRRAAARSQDLSRLVISRDGFEYVYSVPEEWRQACPEGVAALRELARELSPLLAELTGPVVLRRLSGIADLRRSKIAFEAAQ